MTLTVKIEIGESLTNLTLANAIIDLCSEYDNRDYLDARKVARAILVETEEPIK